MYIRMCNPAHKQGAYASAACLEPVHVNLLLILACDDDRSLENKENLNILPLCMWEIVLP